MTLTTRSNLDIESKKPLIKLSEEKTHTSIITNAAIKLAQQRNSIDNLRPIIEQFFVLLDIDSII